VKRNLMKRSLSNRTLAWLCVAVLLTSLMPLYAISFYNHAGCDDFGTSLLARSAWQGEKVWSKEYGQYVLINLRPYKGLPEGFPDLFYIGPGRATAFVEVKTDKGRTSEAQSRFHALLQRFGHKICVARSAEDAVSFINREI